VVEPQRQLEPASRGEFCHDVLRRLFGRLPRRDGAVWLAELGAPELEAALDAAVAEAAEEVEKRRPPYPALWALQRQQMRDDIRRYLLAAAGEDRLRTRCLHFELGFGVGAAPVEGLDPASRAEPATMRTPAGEVRLRGRIDRVDRVEVQGNEGLLVVDYKTGRLPGAKDIAEGRDLQLAVYIEAAEQLLGAPSLGGLFQKIGRTAGPAARTMAAFTLRGGVPRPAAGFAEARERAAAAVGAIVEAVRGGRFDAAPTHQCASWCPFRQACHYSEARAELKSLVRPAGDEEDEA